MRFVRVCGERTSAADRTAGTIQSNTHPVPRSYGRQLRCLNTNQTGTIAVVGIPAPFRTGHRGDNRAVVEVAARYYTGRLDESDHALAVAMKRCFHPIDR